MQRQIDLFKRLSDEGVREKKAGISALSVAVILVFCICLAILLSITFYLTRENGSIYSQIERVAARVDDPETQTVIAELNTLQAMTAQNNGIATLGSFADMTIAAQNGFNADIYGIIMAQKPARVTLAGIVYADGAITLSCVTEDNNPPADFAQKLDGCGAFTSVKYAGFSQDGDERIVFTIICS